MDNLEAKSAILLIIFTIIIFKLNDFYSTVIIFNSSLQY